MTLSVTWPLEPQLVVSYWSSIDTMSLSRTVAERLSVKNNWVMSLTPRCHVTSLVTWRLQPHMVLSYWWSVHAKSLSRMVAKILSVNNNWVMSLTPRCHVRSLVMWPLEPHMFFPNGYPTLNCYLISRTFCWWIMLILFIFISFAQLVELQCFCVRPYFSFLYSRVLLPVIIIFLLVFCSA